MPSADFNINGVPMACINQAAAEYFIPATLIISVLKTENGRIGSASKNKNGTFDYGPMQINTVWINKLENYGFSQHDIQYDPCLNVFAGSWILSQSMAEANTQWQGVGDYHSHRAAENLRYRVAVSKHYQKLIAIINGASINVL